MRGVESFSRLDDQDIETLISGGIPEAEDLTALVGLVAELRSMAKTPLPEDAIAFYAAEAAAANAIHKTDTARSQSGGGRFAPRLRRRVMSMAASLAMLLGATGMAWAANGAVPGDWNYGLDRALEAIGIGAGGAAERLEELQALGVGEAAGPAAPVTTASTAPPADDHRDSNLASEIANARRPAFVYDLLLYLNSVDRVDRTVMSAIARGQSSWVRENGPAADKGKPDDAGPPADKGKPDDAGPPADKGKPDK